ncbi:penicillin-binding protein activator [Methylomonas sp. AM2-LC]|uniref:penicillin-binding protein activator n=1 Tax=Methylomonas sp. AM2-LC TaxID=3153301 RepID=UPI0032678040
MTDSRHVFIMPCYGAICWFLSLLIITACSHESVKPEAMQRSPAQQQGKKAELPQNNISPYALANSQASQHLLNAETFLNAGNQSAAVRELDIINYANLASEQRSKFNLLDTQIALNNGDAERALTKLTNIRPKLLNDTDKINYYQSLAFAYSLTGNIIQGVNARIRLGNLLLTPQQQQDNIISILDMLSTLSLDELSAPPATMDDLNGWMALAKIFKQRDQAGVELNAQIRQWRQLYPKHPANADFLQTYLAKPATDMQTNIPESTELATVNTAHIAVLLPASGSLTQAGKVIKEGLQIAQQLASKSTQATLPLKFYDTEQGDISTLYKQAVAEGAKQIIGPLVKEQIQTLAKSVELSVPVLALNHVEDLSKPNLYQFGLSPIDEAEQLALKAWRDGRQTALLLVPNTSQGQRIGQYMTTAWQSNGGLVSGMQSYDPKQHDIGDMLKALLSSTSDATKTNQAQTVFVSANPEVGRELAVQLKYYQNADLAVYAMPNIYSGQPDPIRDAELGKINFCDIPWFFADLYKGAQSQAALQQHWQTLSDTQIRLLALGMDAYNLVGHLPELSSKAFTGSTGHLSINSENRITRKLVCAQFKGGIPVASGFIE